MVDPDGLGFTMGLPHVWAVMVAAQRVAGELDFVWAAVWVVAAAAVARLAWLCYGKAKEDVYGDHILLAGLLTVVTVAFAIAAVLCADWGLTRILLPEYSALNEIMSAVKK